MFRINSYIFRSVESLGEYLKLHKGKTFVVEYISEYTLNDPMEQ
jgi:hypothetical protein